jgi:hypothetical protein
MSPKLEGMELSRLQSFSRMATKFSENEPQEEGIWLMKKIHCSFKTSN